MMAGGPVLDEKERRDYSLVCDFYIFRQLHSLSSLFLQPSLLEFSTIQSLLPPYVHLLCNASLCTNNHTM